MQDCYCAAALRALLKRCWVRRWVALPPAIHGRCVCYRHATWSALRVPWSCSSESWLVVRRCAEAVHRIQRLLFLSLPVSTCFQPHPSSPAMHVAPKHPKYPFTEVVVVVVTQIVALTLATYYIASVTLPTYYIASVTLATYYIASVTLATYYIASVGVQPRAAHHLRVVSAASFCIRGARLRPTVRCDVRCACPNCLAGFFVGFCGCLYLQDKLWLLPAARSCMHVLC
jgi:hypothetical protein